MILSLNNQIADLPDFSEQRFEKGFSIYEVIRIFKGEPLFLSDNLLRLENSINKSRFSLPLTDLHVKEKINRFISLQNIEEGNVKYVLHFHHGKVDEYLYMIKSTYPSQRDYEQGVRVISCQAERSTPRIKYIDYSLRLRMDELMQQKEAYEIALVNKRGEITEGSRSNLFFISSNVLYTAPPSSVLSGTSRKRVIDICKQQGFALREEKIPYQSLYRFNAAFITGTSPLILPINQFDDLLFNAQNKLLRRLMLLYFSKLT